MIRPPVGAVELVTIGDELLLGETVDGNSAWLGRTLAAHGVRVSRRATVGDDLDAIRAAIGEALERVDVVICTGGLGPTRDDLTRDAVAALTGRPLQPDAEVFATIRARFERLGRTMADINRVQALVPQGAAVLPNSRGTAPGLIVPAGSDRAVVLLPGVPAEMRAIVEEHMLTWLHARWPQLVPVGMRLVRTTGIPESTLAERIEDLVSAAGDVAVAFLPSSMGVDVRLTRWGGSSEALDALAEALAQRMRRWVYGRDDATLEDAVAAELGTRRLRLALAESCTGGLIAKRLTDRPGASAHFAGGVVAYANEAKTALLGVREDTLREHGAVSGDVAREMAAGARRIFGADASIAVTGIAGPDGGTPDKPVGTVWIALSVGDSSTTRHFRFNGSRDEIRERAAQAALVLLLRALRGDEDGDGDRA